MLAPLQRQPPAAPGRPVFQANSERSTHTLLMHHTHACWWPVTGTRSPGAGVHLAGSGARHSAVQRKLPLGELGWKRKAAQEEGGRGLHAVGSTAEAGSRPRAGTGKTGSGNTPRRNSPRGARTMCTNTSCGACAVSRKVVPAINQGAGQQGSSALLEKHISGMHT